MNTSKSNLPWIIGFSILLIISIGSIFTTYWYLDKILNENSRRTSNENNNAINICPIECTPQCQDKNNDMPECIVPSNNSDTTDNYLNDTVYFITSEGDLALIATISRVGRGDNYTQTTRISYFDGNDWSREVVRGQRTDTKDIVPNELLTSWDIKQDEEKIMVKELAMRFDFGKKNSVVIRSSELKDEMPLKTEPDYTKFFSKSEATIDLEPYIKTNKPIIDIELPSISGYLVHSRIYSDDASKVLIYDDDFAYNTDWLIFWDEEGGFHHIDVTKVEEGVENYKSHSIAYYVDREGRVSRSYDIQVSNNNITAPTSTVYNVRGSVNTLIQSNHQNNFKKYPTLEYPWLIGVTQGVMTNGSGQTIEGIGIYEFIYNSVN